MAEFDSLPERFAHKGMAIIAGVVVLGCVLVGYAFHEHRTAQDLATQNAQQVSALSATQHQIGDLTAKVNELATRAEAPPAPTAPQPARVAAGSRPAAAHRRADDPRFKKLQAQLDAQGKEIDDTRTGLTTTQGNLDSARTELTGSIAHTHDELVLLEKKGERSYAEFDLPKVKEFRRAGPLQIRLKKANGRHQFADLELMVNDRNLSQKHVNIYQPVMFSTPDSQQPVEVVINDIGKDHIHGYVSSSKYQQSDLAAMSNASENSAQNPDQAQANTTDQPEPRKKLPLPQQ
ncbi:MAG: hypothetical protein WA802_13170 [Terracidiphilus sp.]